MRAALLAGGPSPGGGKAAGRSACFLHHTLFLCKGRVLPVGELDSACCFRTGLMNRQLLEEGPSGLSLSQHTW